MYFCFDVLTTAHAQANKSLGMIGQLVEAYLLQSAKSCSGPPMDLAGLHLEE